MTDMDQESEGLIDYLEELGVSEDAMDAVMDVIKSKRPDPIRNTEVSTDDIRVRMLYEPDWRKRAQLAAMIISKNLE